MKKRNTFSEFGMFLFLAALPSVFGCSEPALSSSWVSAGTLLEARQGHSATRLDNGAVLFIGGENASETRSRAEVYETSKKQWSSPQTNGARRTRHASVKLHDGRVLSIGGTNDATSACVEFFDPTTREFAADISWTGDCPGQPVANWIPLSKRVIVVGGMGSSGALPSVVAFDSVINKWSALSSMAVARAGHTVTVIEDGAMLVAGGANELDSTQNTVALYDIAADIWRTGGAMTDARRHHTATLLRDGKILVIGGQNEDGVLSSAEKCQCNKDADTNEITCQWMAVASLHDARHGHTATLLNNGNVLVTGGTDANGKALSSVEMYNVSTNEFVELVPMSVARTGHTATWLSDGSVLVAGGIDAASSVLATAERFVPDDARIPCQFTEECPHAMVCNAELYCEQSEGALSSQPACSYAGDNRPGRTTVGVFAILLAAWRMRRRRVSKRNVASFVGAVVLIVPSLSRAQTRTFYLDRLQMPGGSEDGTAVWRPVFGQTGLFGQVAFGYARNPLRVASFVQDSSQARALSGSAVSLQMTAYATAGIELAKRGAIQVTLPYVVDQRGYPTDARQVGLDEVVKMAPSAAGDMRIDGRMLILWNDSRSFVLGARVAAFLPTGDKFSFTGEGAAWGSVGLSAEYNADAFFLTVNAGLTMRPKGSLVDLTVGSEFAYAVGAYVPFQRDRVRLGAELWGSLGLVARMPEATPVEAALSGRMALGASRRVFLGVSVGGRVGPGYAPDMRFVARFGGVLPFEREQVEPRLPVRFVSEPDAAVDSLFDANDKRPLAENKQAIENHSDTDPDKDGIATPVDTCPLVAEDKDGLADEDGCPEDDFDGDGFVDVKDKCPKEPGLHSEDPAKQGCPVFLRRTAAEVQLVQQIEFEFNRATIAPSSFPILDELMRLLAANPDIGVLRIEGHTDNVGNAKFNETLSLRRAEAVRDYLVQRGHVAPSRLTFVGLGPSRPIASNLSAEGRTKNRRVELHIVK